MSRLVGSDRALGLTVAVVTVLFLIGVVTGVLRSAFTSDGDTTIRAAFADSRQLKPGAPVRIDGVDIGKVQNLTLSADRRTDVVTMKVDGKKAAVLRADARAHIRFRTLLGGAFYVDLDRGTPGVVALGSGTIPATRTDSQVELDDITTVLQGHARKGLDTIPRELSKSLADPDVPAAAIGVIAGQSPAIAGGLQAARGAEPGSDIETLVHATAKTVQALDAPGDRLKAVVAGTASLVQTTARRRSDITAALDRAPADLRLTDATLADLGHTLIVADPVLRNVDRAAADVAPTVSGLRRLITPANRLLADAVPLLRSLRPAVTSLATTARQGTPLLDALDPVLAKLDKTVLPFTGKVDPDNGHTTAQMVGPGISGLAGIGAYLDNNGRYVRFPVSAGNSSLYLPCQTFLNNPDARKLVTCQGLAKSMTTLFGWKTRTTP
jgi:phospholipid/cholesterol/gamma-HCH transport system substrate-binding protein